jgi:uncharacterized delta-60 repeat protein
MNMKNLNLFTALIASLTYTISFCQSGTLDPTFGTAGIVTTSYNEDSDGEAVAIQDDGKIVLVGTTGSIPVLSIRTARYLEDGSLDTSFGTGGTVLAPVAGQGRGATIQPDGKILVAGSAFGMNGVEVFIMRLNIDGTLDTSFGVNGTTSFDNPGFEIVEGMALQSDGKIVVAGTLSTDLGGGVAEIDGFAVRFESDGQPDTSFGNQGITVIGTSGPGESIEDCLVQGDGKIVLVGTLLTFPGEDIMVTRLNGDGTLDNSFGTNGSVVTDVMLGIDHGKSGAIQSDGKILVIGDAELNIGPLAHIDFCTVRYNTDGTLDTTFGSGGGIVTQDLDGGEDIGTSIAVQSDGAIVVAGDGIVSGTSQFGMFRYLTDGTLDATFGNAGKVTTNIGGVEDLCNAMTLAPDSGQYIILAGEASDPSGDSDYALARYENTVGLVSLYEPIKEFQVYPNPISSQSIVRYSLSKNERVSIRLYNLKGELVQTILNPTQQEQGEHQLLLKLPNDLPHGNYLLKIQTTSSTVSAEIHK